MIRGVAVAASLLALAASRSPVSPIVPGREAVAVFAGGCFWGVEAVFEHIRGVRIVVAGYAGGSTASPTYAQVSSGETGHVEAVRITYAPDEVSYAQLLEVFFRVVHDPTQRDRQGPDVGSEYRSIIFYLDSGQRSAAERSIADLGRDHVFAAPIVTEVRRLTVFYPAEDYHQHYTSRHPTDPYVVVNDLPKLARLHQAFPSLYREVPN